MKHIRLLLPLLAAQACSSNSGQSTEQMSRQSIGLAVSETVGSWCAEFAADSGVLPAEGAIASLVFAGDTSFTSAIVRIRARRISDCPTAFPQPRWTSYSAFDVELADTETRRDSLPYLALIVTGNTRWSRGDRGVIRGDIDRDGTPEEIRRCAADEGSHFTVWSIPGNGTPIRRWHEYFDWGVLVEPTCKPGDAGRDVPQ
jgi:hypothetical protein